VRIVVFEYGDAIEVGCPRNYDEAKSPAERLSKEKMNLLEIGGAENWTNT
jgi:hypothetical protein